MTITIDQILNTLKEKLALFLSISFGVFLFVLFFQPFTFEKLDFNNRLLFVAGLGAIVFLFMFLVEIVFPLLIRKKLHTDNDSTLAAFLSGFILLTLTSVAFAFYLRYVGGVIITFYIMLKVVLICLVPIIILRVNDRLTNLSQYIEKLIIEKNIIEKKLDKFNDENLSKTIDFVSDNTSESLKLQIADVAFIKSADNYVEIIFRETGTLKKKLIRNTLKNVEAQIKPYSNFIRCHRTSIVNVYYIEKLIKSDSNHWITIEGSHEQIPVSRQYLLKLKDVL